MINQESGQSNFEKNAGTVAPRFGMRADQPAFRQLHNTKGEQDELLVVLAPRRQNGQRCQQHQPQHIHPVDAGTFFFRHSSTKNYAESGQNSPGVVIFRSVAFAAKSALAPHANPITRHGVIVNATSLMALTPTDAMAVVSAVEQPGAVRATG